MKSSLILAASIAVIGCGGSKSVNLNMQNSSGESGKATLTDKGNNTTEVLLALSGGNDNGAQIAHIHVGQCANLGAPYVTLTSVQNGVSATTVAYKLTDLEGGRYAINIHNSQTPTVVTTYVACGDIN